MPVAASRLSLVRTDRWRPEFELREDGRALGTLAWDARDDAALARIGRRAWTLRPGPVGSAVQAHADDARVEATLRDGAISFADRTPDLRWCRNRTPGCRAELLGAGGSARLRVRRRTSPGLDVTVDGQLPRRELLVLLAGHALRR
jgi:hypothetical protein